MKILIADDEPLARQRLQRLVGDINPSYEVYADASNGLEALKQCITLQPDIAFLDIRMPKMDGLQTAAEIVKANLNTHIVFVTAYDEYALKAFDNNAIDYLLKPVKKERLHKAIEKTIRLNGSPDTIMPATQPPLNQRQHLCAHTHSGLKVVDLKDIISFKADNKYVLASTHNDSILLDESLKALEEEFSELFFRIHRNALVNINAIKVVKKIAAGQFELHLQGIDETFAISRRHRAELNKLLRQKPQATKKN
ncbi:MAG: DNA-binding response regulator [Cycloclasticus sp.]|nr:MAG: DNA-binding response regulator [Cycloclasticus sp.]